MDYRTKTISPVEGVSITVRETVGMDAIDQSGLFPALQYDRTKRRMRSRAENFLDMVIRTVSVEGLPFLWPDADATDAELQAGFEGWQALPNNVVVPWANALLNIDKATDPNELPKKEDAESSAPSTPTSSESSPPTSESDSSEST